MSPCYLCTHFSYIAFGWHGGNSLRDEFLKNSGIKQTIYYSCMAYCVIWVNQPFNIMNTWTNSCANECKKYSFSSPSLLSSSQSHSCTSAHHPLIRAGWRATTAGSLNSGDLPLTHFTEARQSPFLYSLMISCICIIQSPNGVRFACWSMGRRATEPSLSFLRYRRLLRLPTSVMEGCVRTHLSVCLFFDLIRSTASGRGK